MKECLPEGPEHAASKVEAAVQAAALPATPPEEGADPDQYLWGV